MKVSVLPRQPVNRPLNRVRRQLQPFVALQALDLLVEALKDDPGLAEISDYTTDSGEGRWTVEEAIRHSVPANVISAALFARFASRQESGSPTLKAVSALRQQFGGHSVRPAGS